jgi:UDP-GlcNAc:undecaprenyl-phosphate GlcNAc-1-phosphate transferase
MTTILAIFFISLLISLVLTPLAGKLGKKFGGLDIPSERKVHTSSIPRSGGLAIFVAFFLTLALSTFFMTDVSNKLVLDKETTFFVLGALMVFGVGLFDDFHRLGHKVKFLIQIIGASVAFWGGIRIGSFAIFGMSFDLGWMSYFVTVFWFLLFINAINLIDGLDGLAAGICFFSSFVMLILLAINGNFLFAMLFSSLAGALLGFLRYNFNPASIFMGDGGSYFLGYAIAGLSIMCSIKSQLGAVMLIPVLALGVPIFDTILSPLRRFLIGRGMFKADKKHIHHKLLAMGLSTRKIVLITYGITCVLCLFAIVVVNLRDEFAGLFLIILAVGAFLFVRKLGYLDYVTSEKFYGWFKDITDTAGFTLERRSFLDIQIKISKSENLRDLWKNTCCALEMLEFDIAEFRPQGRSDHDPANKSHFAKYWVPEEEQRNNGGKNTYFWKRGKIDVTEYARKDALLKLELPLVNGNSERAIGTLSLVKDLKRDQITPYTLRRVEHLRRTIVRVLGKLEEREGRVENWKERKVGKEKYQRTTAVVTGWRSDYGDRERPDARG